MSGPVPHVDSGEIRETANEEDIPPTSPDNPDENESKNEAANGEESESEGSQTTSAFGSSF